jgi:hypothetical protein
MFKNIKTPDLLEDLEKRLNRVSILLSKSSSQNHVYAPWIAKLILEKEIDEVQR